MVVERIYLHGRRELARKSYNTWDIYGTNTNDGALPCLERSDPIERTFVMESYGSPSRGSDMVYLSYEDIVASNIPAKIYLRLTAENFYYGVRNGKLLVTDGKVTGKLVWYQAGGRFYVKVAD